MRWQRPDARTITIGTVAAVAVIAAVVSYAHMQELAVRHGEGWRSYLIPLSVDGLVLAATMTLLGCARRHALAWSALIAGMTASLLANMADARVEVIAVLIAGWPAAAFAVAFKLLLQQLSEVVGTELSPASADRLSPSEAIPSVPPSPALVTSPVEPPPPRPAQSLSTVPATAPSLSAVPSVRRAKSKRDIAGLSRDEICERFGVSRATAYRWLQESQEATA